MTNEIAPRSTAILVLSGDELLRKPTKRELHTEIEKLFLLFPDPNRTEVAKIAALYAQILSQFSAWSIKEGVRRIISGEVRDLNRNFLPSTAAVAHVIRTVAENSPEEIEKRWRSRLAIWEAGRDWSSFWGLSPEDRGFEHDCPPHLLEAFKAETMRRFIGRRH